MNVTRLIVGISGASAPVCGIRTLELLQQVPDVETHFVYTEAAEKTTQIETSFSIPDIRQLADFYYEPDDISKASTR